MYTCVLGDIIAVGCEKRNIGGSGGMSNICSNTIIAYTSLIAINSF